MSGAPRLFLIFSGSQGKDQGPSESSFSDIVTAGFAADLDESAVASALILTQMLPDDRDSRAGWQDGLKSAVSRLQSRNVAVLLDDLSLVGLSGADGVHVSPNFDRAEDAGVLETQQQDTPVGLTQAIKALKPQGIVGAGGLHSRHAAMSVGEMDVDYVMFGEPGNNGWVPPFDAVRERASWWTQIFTTPCVVYAPDLKSVGPLAETGAEFIALNAGLLTSGSSPGALIAAAARAMRTGNPCR